MYFLARVLDIKLRILGATQVEFICNWSGVFMVLVAGFIMKSGLNVIGAACSYVIIAAVMLVSKALSFVEIGTGLDRLL